MQCSLLSERDALLDFDPLLSVIESTGRRYCRRPSRCEPNGKEPPFVRIRGWPFFYLFVSSQELLPPGSSSCCCSCSASLSRLRNTSPIRPFRPHGEDARAIQHLKKELVKRRSVIMWFYRGCGMDEGSDWLVISVRSPIGSGRRNFRDRPDPAWPRVSCPTCGSASYRPLRTGPQRPRLGRKFSGRCMKCGGEFLATRRAGGQGVRNEA